MNLIIIAKALQEQIARLGQERVFATHSYKASAPRARTVNTNMTRKPLLS